MSQDNKSSKKCIKLINRYVQKYQGSVAEESRCHSNIFIFDVELIATIVL